jgi:hypothetical protein
LRKPLLLPDLDLRVVGTREPLLAPVAAGAALRSG